MKHMLPYIVNLPPFIYRGVDIEEYNFSRKIFFIIKGKILGFFIERLSGSTFCYLINLFYRDEEKIFFENSYYKKTLPNTGIIHFPNKRILRMVNKPDIQLNRLLKSYCIDKNIIFKGDTVIDCGANVGELNVALKNRGIQVNYIGFEPDPETFNCLKLNNPEKNNTLFMNALSNRKSEEKYFIDSDGGNSSLVDFGKSESITVSAITLDSLNIDYEIRLLKIDAEGFEPEVLSGALKTLDYINYISVDYGHERGVKEESTIVDVNKFLYSNNFELIKFSEYRLIGLYENKKFK